MNDNDFDDIFNSDIWENLNDDELGEIYLNLGYIFSMKLKQTIIIFLGHMMMYHTTRIFHNLLIMTQTSPTQIIRWNPSPVCSVAVKIVIY